MRRISSTMLAATLLAVAFATVACHGSTDPTFGNPEGPLVLPPIPDNGGRVVQNMVVVPIFYAGDPEQTPVMAFLNQFAKQGDLPTQAWFAAVNELGQALKTMTIHAPIVLTGDPPVELDDPNRPSDPGFAPVRPYIRQLVASGKLPAYQSGMIYVFYAPLGLKSRLGAFQGCTDYVGYHNHDPNFAPPPAAVPDGGTPVGPDAGFTDALYSLILRCPSSGYSTDQLLDSVTSHELAEAASDPDLDAHSLDLYNVLDEGENGDLCAWEPGTTADGKFTFQRMWSNAEDLKGNDPCVPNAGDIAVPPVASAYANVVPEPAAVTATPGGTAHFDLHVVSPNGTVAAGSRVDVYIFVGNSNDKKYSQTQILKAQKVGDIVPLDVKLPPDIQPSYVWINFLTVYSQVSNAFAGIHVVAP